jgi:adenylosuccinate lyase
VHEVIREQSMAAIKAYKSGETGEIDLLDRLQTTSAFASVDMESALNAADYIGRSSEQVDEFIASQVDPVRQRYPNLLRQNAELHV